MDEVAKSGSAASRGPGCRADGPMKAIRKLSSRLMPSRRVISEDVTTAAAAIYDLEEDASYQGCTTETLALGAAAVLGSRWWAFMAVAAAASLAILPEVAAVDTPNSGFSALSPGIIVWIAITGSVSLLETVAARVAHALGYLSLLGPSWVEALDLLGAVGFVSGTALLGQILAHRVPTHSHALADAASGASGRHVSYTVSASDYADDAGHRDALCVAATLGLLLAPLLRVPACLHRRRCWALAAEGGEVQEAHPMRQLRRTAVAAQCVVVLLIVAAAQMQSVFFVNGAGRADLAAPLAVEWAAADAARSSQSAMTTFSDALTRVNESGSCMEALWVGSLTSGQGVSARRLLNTEGGVWGVENLDTPTAAASSAHGLLAVVSDDGVVAGVFRDGCARSEALLMLYVKLALVALALVLMTLIDLGALWVLLGPMPRILRSLTWAGSHLDSTGVIIEHAQVDGTEGLTLADAAKRITKSTRLMLRAAFQGRNVVRKLLQDAKARGAHEDGLMELFGSPAMPPVRGIAWAGRSKEPSEVPSRAPPGGNAASNGPAAGRVVSKDWWRGRHRSASDWRVPPGDRRATEPFRPREGGQSATEVGKRVQVSRAASNFEQNSLSVQRVTSRRGRRRLFGSYHPSRIFGKGDDAFSLETTWVSPPQLPLESEQEREALQDFGTLAWDALSVPKEHLSECVVHMFRVAGLLDESVEDVSDDQDVSSFQDLLMPQSYCDGPAAGTAPAAGTVPAAGAAPAQRGPVHVSVLRRFLQEIQSNYLDNPYHRWEHAVDVTHTTFLLLKKLHFFRRKYLSRRDMFCMLVASIAHDVGHRGVSNTHLVNTGDILALTYNDQSPQENMHASALFQLCHRTPEANIFARLTREDFRYCRELIIDLILDTDMSQHFRIVGELEELRLKAHSRRQDGTQGVDSGAEGDARLPSVPSDSEVGARSDVYETPDVRVLMRALVHLADLGSILKCPTLHAKWSSLITQEFFFEGKLQRELGMTPPALMDALQCYVPKSQMDYIEFVCRPLLTALCDLMPEMRDLRQAVARNYSFWLSMVVEDGRMALQEAPLPLEHLPAFRAVRHDSLGSQGRPEATPGGSKGRRRRRPELPRLSAPDMAPNDGPGTPKRGPERKGPHSPGENGDSPKGRELPDGVSFILGSRRGGPVGPGTALRAQMLGRSLACMPVEAFADTRAEHDALGPILQSLRGMGAPIPESCVRMDAVAKEASFVDLMGFRERQLRR